MENIVLQAKYMWRLKVKYARRPRRYAHLLEAIRRRRPRRILEIGVYDGIRAVEMIEAACISRPASEVEYFGFDLFDMLSDELLQAELSKKPLPMEVVQKRIEETGAHVTLYRGFSQDTLPQYLEEHRGEQVDFVFIDGGHAVETITSDWRHVETAMDAGTVVLFDDYYVDCPHLTDRFGCNGLIEGLRAKKTFFPTVDHFNNPDGRLSVAVVQVESAAGAAS